MRHTSMMNGLGRKIYYSGILCLMLLSSGCGPKKATTGSIEALEAYVTEAKLPIPGDKPAEGSLWSGTGRQSDLFRDPKAREINDMVTIRVVESTTATATADAANSKDTSVTAGYGNLLGLEKKVKELPTLASGKTSSSYSGKGSTSRVTTLQTSLTARIVDVLPNGYLLVQGDKEIRLNNENQTVQLTGVIRPEDISRDNTILSSAVAQMTVRVHGRGVVSRAVNPGWLYKVLTGVLPF